MGRYTGKFKNKDGNELLASHAGHLIVDDITNSNLLDVPNPYILTGKQILYLDKPLQIGTYTIGFSSKVTDGADNCRFMFMNNNETIEDRIFYGKSQETFTITSEVNQIIIVSQDTFVNADGKTTTFNELMLCEGTELLPYTEYKHYGYNKDISMGQITVDDIKSKNKLDLNTMVELKGLFRYIVNGEIQSNPDYDGIKIPVKPNTGYSFSTDAEKWSNLCFFDNSFNFISSNSFNEGNYIITPNNCYYITLAIMKGYTWAQLEQGNVITNYSPFYKYGYNSADSMGNIVVDNIECKNKLDLSTFQTQTLNGITLVNNGNGTITINGTANITFGITFFVFKLKAGIYHLSLNTPVPSDFYIWDRDLTESILMKEATAVLTTDHNNVAFDVWFNQGVVYDNVTIFPQLEKGDKATPPTPYKEFSNLQHYSTNEQIVGTWYDGRTLYQRIFIFTSGWTYGSEALFYYPSSITNFRELVDFKAIYARSDGTYGGLPNYHEAEAWRLGIYDFAFNNVKIYVGSNFENIPLLSITLTLTYTKNE